MTLAVFVAGDPAAKGNIRYLGQRGGRAILTDATKGLKPWDSRIRSTLLDDEGRPRAVFSDGVHVEAEFVMPRPKSTPKSKTPPAIKKPDLDKLARALLDAITSAGVWRDDAQVTGLAITKRIAKLGETPGCHIEIMDAIDREAK